MCGGHRGLHLSLRRQRQMGIRDRCGPVDVIRNKQVGVLDDDLQKAVLAAIGLSSDDCRNYASKFSWRNCAASLLSNLSNNRSVWN